MNSPDERRWALSPLDSRSHVLPGEDWARPIGTLLALCGHVMPCSAQISTGPLRRTVCEACEVLATLKVPAPVFVTRHPDGGYRAQPRLSVTISRRTEAVLLEVSVSEGVSVTEAVRRLVGYGHLVYDAARAGRDVVLRGGGRPTERLILLDEPAGQGLGPLTGPGAGSWRDRHRDG